MLTHAIQLADGEEVVAIIRRHWFHLAVEGFIDMALFALVFLGVGVADAFLTNAGLAAQQALSASLFLLASTALVLWMHFFASWSDHWLDAWVITNRRIIDIEQHGFFHREVSSFPLDRIQDITFDVAGIIAMWLHFGDVRIQTASITDDLIMRQVPFPEDVKEHVVEALEHARRRAGQQ